MTDEHRITIEVECSRDVLDDIVELLNLQLGYMADNVIVLTEPIAEAST
jgi:hypothetical protein